jgi:hypothetical protein
MDLLLVRNHSWGVRQLLKMRHVLEDSLRRTRRHTYVCTNLEQWRSSSHVSVPESRVGYSPDIPFNLWVWSAAAIFSPRSASPYRRICTSYLCDANADHSLFERLVGHTVSRDLSKAISGVKLHGMSGPTSMLMPGGLDPSCTVEDGGHARLVAAGVQGDYVASDILASSKDSSFVKASSPPR